MKKRLCSVLLAIVLSVGLLPVGAQAATASWAADAVTTLNDIYGSNGSGPFSADDGAMTEGDLNTLKSATGWNTTVSLGSWNLSPAKPATCWPMCSTFRCRRAKPPSGTCMTRIS